MPAPAAAPVQPRGTLRTPFAGLAVCAALALLVAGCATSATLAPAPTGERSNAPRTQVPRTTATPAGEPTAEPNGEPTAEPTEEPTPEEPTPEPSQQPTDEPTAEPSELPSASPSASPGAAGPAAACTGTADNRDFYQALAGSVTWDVYCAVLPAGWHVESGSYRLRGGGQMTISYKGPGGARLELKEGAFCSGVDGCPPAGGAAGSASFGGRSARLTDLGGARFAVIAEDGSLAWQASGTGMDADALKALTAAFALVGE